jgi:hypothetical protein
MHSQTHQQFLGKSDLFFVCMLQPLSFDITKQDSEIEAAQVLFIFLTVYFLVLELDIVVHVNY